VNVAQRADTRSARDTNDVVVIGAGQAGLAIGYFLATAAA
jgi:cation diffusion facilitator CzcD-associated flavoprotein CzcO